MKRGESTLESYNSDADPRQPAFWLQELHEGCTEMDREWTTGEASHRGRQAAYLAAFVRSAGKATAAGTARVSMNTARKWQTEDPIFQPCFEMAKGALNDVLVSECRRRAVEGVSITTYDRNGQPIGEERKYSDAMLMFLIKGMDPESRWVKKVDLGGVSEERWRSVMAAAMANPEALEALDKVADLLGGVES